MCALAIRLILAAPGQQANIASAARSGRRSRFDLIGSTSASFTGL